MSDTLLPTRPFGRTGMSITRIGFGAWAVGGTGGAFGWGHQDDANSISAIHRAVDLGINWIDTAPVYGAGHSEEVVGRAVAQLAAGRRPYIFTKCGLVWDSANTKAMPRNVGAAHSIRRELEASLKRLDVDCIDLYQMHWPAKDVQVEDYWGVLLDLKKEGKIRAAGLSNHTKDLLERAECLGHVDTLQPPFSAIRRDFAANELPWCRDHGTGVIVYSPMQAGLLTGAFSIERARSLPKNDWRSGHPQFTGEKLQANLRLADLLRSIAERRRTSTAAVAIAWTLAWPGIDGAIVGARTPEQVDGWADAGRLELTAEDLAEIAAGITTIQVGSGPPIPL